MNYLRAFIFISILGGILYVSIIYESNPNVIDDEYVASKSYNQLLTDLEEDKSQILTSSQKVEQILNAVLKQNSAPVFTLPYEISLSLLVKEHKAINKWEEDQGLRFVPIAKGSQGDVKIILVLVKAEVAETDIVLVMATAQRESLIDQRVIGQYKDTIAQKVDTKIAMDSTGCVAVKMIRNQVYPVAQENVHSLDYCIASSGHIMHVKS